MHYTMYIKKFQAFGVALALEPREKLWQSISAHNSQVRIKYTKAKD